MRRPFTQRPSPGTSPHLRILAEQAFSRAAGAPLIPGNSVKILKDAAQNYPAWIDAMRSAKKSIHFESYIIHDDEAGEMFAHVLADKAREGVRVRLIYDWLGALGRTSARFWEKLRDVGVEIRCFNPPQLYHPLSWISRDHRKMLAVDGKVGFVTGLCVGQMWEGYPEQGIPPWRDTGIMVKGPAVADIEHAFADIWATMGLSLPEEEVPERSSINPEGDVMLRVVASIPNTAGLFRLDQFIASVARESLWLTDAYFIGLTPYVQALRAAAMDGVDVRLLVPGTTDIPILRAVSRSGYQPLLEAGVRIFEWNGPMLHAKTAVADGRWARIGSSNLNVSSWLGNYELDVAVENGQFAEAMERMYLEDLANSTEIELGRRHAVFPAVKRPPRDMRMKGKDSMGRAGVGVLRAGRVVGAAITNRRELAPAEARVMLGAGLSILALAVVAVIWPRVMAVPFAVVAAWIAVALLSSAYRTWMHRDRDPSPGPPGDGKQNH